MKIYKEKLASFVNYFLFFFQAIRVYPLLLMKELYQGKLKHENIDSAIRELNEIELLFKKLGTNKVVWDIDNLKLSPPWRDNISSDIHNLSEYFWTNDGYNLFEIIREALEEGKKEQVDVELKSI